MALETWARCASWLGNNRTLLTCCHCLINNNNYHVRHSALGFSKHLSCDGWKCSEVPGPRATQPQGAPRWAALPRALQPLPAARGALPVLQDAASCRMLRQHRPTQLISVSSASCRRGLEACREQGRLWAAAVGAAVGLHRAGLSQVARTIPSPWLCPAAASWPRAPAAGGEGQPRALHRDTECLRHPPGQGQAALCVAVVSS